MYEEILRLALGNGLWAVLFCVLFLYQLKDSRAREKKYADTVDSLLEGVKGVKEVHSVCLEIQKDVEAVRACRVSKSAQPSALKTAALKKEAL